MMHMDDGFDDELQDLVPLAVERSKSQQIGLKSSISIKSKPLKKETSMNNKKYQGTLTEQGSQDDWLETHRKWKQWKRFHKGIGNQAEDKDLTSPFVSPLYSVLQFAKNTDVSDPTPLRQLLCEHQKRAAFRLFALKYQCKLYQCLS